jgi:hypothetical protein
MTFSPEVLIRPRFDSLEKWLVAQTAGKWESGSTTPGSDARLGDGGSLSTIFGHAHGAQILESRSWTELRSLEDALKVATSCHVLSLGNFVSRSFLRPCARK